MGWWLFTEHEVVLIGERGSFRPVERVPSVFDAPVRAHSQKPDEFYALAERMYPGTRRVELFARTKRPGWGDVWGNQV
jgi:N6-adenosine-specific RNA methylase IME4